MNGFDTDPPGTGTMRGAAPRLWRHDEGAMFAGVCAGLAEDLDLPLPLVRLVAILFLILPTGLAYLALGVLLRRRTPVRRPFVLHPSPQARPAAPAARNGRAAAAPPLRQDWALLRHRFATLEPRISRIEGVVTADDFELHRDFRRMEP